MIRLLVPALALLFLTGCGSIADVLGTAIAQTFPVHQPQRTGSVSDGGADSANVWIGDGIGNTEWRGFYGFQMAAPLPGYQLKSAKLRVTQSSVIGTPYAQLPPMLVERVELAGAMLVAADFANPVLALGVLGVTTDALADHEIVVTSLVQNAIAANQTMLDLRLRFVGPLVAGNHWATLEKDTALLTLEWEKI